MSYHNKRNPDTEALIRSGLISHTAECFLCGEPITDRFVFWKGSTSDGIDIALHEDCANRLGWDLVKDAAILRLDAQKRGRS